MYSIRVTDELFSFTDSYGDDFGVAYGRLGSILNECDKGGFIGSVTLLCDGEMLENYEYE